jgi:uncharacterized protein YecE (DUF72 family)
MKAVGSIHIGTSGWHYDHWSGPFYPGGLAKKDFLGYYAERFHTVEINNSFYRIPGSKTLKTWKNTVPSTFIFSVKGSRYITHMKKLKDPQEPVSNFLHRMDRLEKNLGPILFQLPPRWNINPDRLCSFLNSLPKDYRYAFEFRDPSWYEDEIFEMLKKNGAAFCIYELAGHMSPKEVTADFIYVRLHGPKGAYEGQYDTRVLSGWAGAFSSWAGQDKEIFCYFDNDQAGYAARDALRLQKMISGE